MVIAERSFQVSGSEVTEVSVRIFSPERHEQNWSCQYEIDWPDKIVVRKIYGLDSAQALVLAIYMIGTDLYSSSYHEQGRLTLDGKKGAFGFPVPRLIRENTRGYDDL
jgi:hypothetical protein